MGKPGVNVRWCHLPAALLLIVSSLLVAAPGPVAWPAAAQGEVGPELAQALAGSGIPGATAALDGNTLVITYVQPAVGSPADIVGAWGDVFELASEQLPSSLSVRLDIATSPAAGDVTQVEATMLDILRFRADLITPEEFLASLNVRMGATGKAPAPPAPPPVAAKAGGKAPGLVQKPAGAGAGPRTLPAAAGPRLAFSSNVQGSYDIYTVQADGSSLARLTNSPGEDWYPAWSPDATQIAFGCMKGGNLELCVMNADGSNPRQLTRYGKAGSVLRPSWSPDGSRIAFALESSQGPTAIYVTGAGGGVASRLADGRDPAWAPDGSRIAFMEMTGLGGVLSVINTDGSGLQRLTQNEGFAMYPAWSPDGSQIAYTTREQGLFIVNADGSGARKVSDHTSWGLAWSPDGTRLAISDDGSLILLNTDGSGERTLAQGIQPSWSK